MFLDVGRLKAHHCSAKHIGAKPVVENHEAIAKRELALKVKALPSEEWKEAFEPHRFIGRGGF